MLDVCLLILAQAQTQPTDAEVAAAAGLSIVVIVGILVVALVLAFLPGIIASSRGHRSAMAIWLCAFLGMFCTFGVLWLVALIWSLTGDTHGNALRG